ncbi:DNA mismatch repair protein MutS [Leadbettera azotonutricia]|uniref:DNA mismatch repair protein MutS n=1 Tax=Leadbettera azotonutricia (strain ATCC BAA-888 / DSM 13862 / ZAS-9) TaxID=545695 RepID=F5YBM6_LEAAZ|nr:DNA mismatch repair protein MutS [Leadbettera azotonutricia]AEF81136.1 DNA mismatch repair protein MutS [Leadbettera azotonutricia ZAS-9]
MLDQYRRIKRDHQGEVLFFRLGDFYEMFQEDAVEVSSLLNLTLTSRTGQPMCGVPYHAARSYIARLMRLGKKVAICEQISEPGNGLIERQVVEIITPGTTIDEDYLDRGSSNYLACLALSKESLSFAYIDLSIGDFYATSFPSENAAELLRGELERLDVKEMIIQESLLEEYKPIKDAIDERTGLVLNRWADWLFDKERSRERLNKQFGSASLKGFGLGENAPEIISAGALLDYLDDTAKTLIPHVRAIAVYDDSEFVGIDEATQRNLELIRNLQDGENHFTLLEVMDHTRTAMGRRLLKGRILHPLRDAAKINARLGMVEKLYHNQEKLGCFRDMLAKTPDLERLCSRIAMDKAHGKDMAAVKNALNSFGLIYQESRVFDFQFESPEAALLAGEKNSQALVLLGELKKLLEKGLAEDPSILLTEGKLIQEGFDPELDRLRELRDNGRKTLETYLEEEKGLTGIASLKIRYNRLIGYYFEVNKNHLSKVPGHFIRRQGMATGERYTTNRLGELESEINGASDKIIELEKKLFLEIREQAKSCLESLGSAGRYIAELDAAQSLARASTIHGWARPIVDNENRLRIIEGRHPVVEAHLPRGEFIPNDVILDEAGIAFALITGPNMAGKSTYLRQAALTVIMAQAGSFVPAEEAIIGMCDRIYCRVGASDSLARGESTFLVEMNETAYILHTATEKSLVIMDEIGRGTGTNDGLSIAWAVCEDLLDRIKCRTLFATHYHELSQISHPRMSNRSMEVSDNNGEIVFLRKLKEGSTSNSYGLHAARLAGLPETVLERAGEILETLEAANPIKAQIPPHEKKESKVPSEREAKFLSKLAKLDPDSLTPLEALNLIHEWKKSVSVPGENFVKRRSLIKDESGGPSLFDTEI